MEIYSHEWMETELGKDIEYSRIFGTFMRMEIPIIEKEDEYVLYTDMDIIFNGFFVKFGGNLFFISTVSLFFFLNPIKSCRYVCFLVTLKTPHH
ncbi:hypothetical protein BN890_15990 [Bacteroides xylanisolvens SD CC 1b]|uniref:Uncharacterized protein n=1 Tax=Bacteroides xylanisolvens SD CC 1b TaxID=702447 RepID=W6PJ04_9BACE|nr:hypothetical protein BN890_15990 [Bacteroides xylanisolvens SD CC 1b]